MNELTWWEWLGWFLVGAILGTILALSIVAVVG